MIDGFAGGIRSIVTTTTIAGYVCVIEIRWNPAIGSVAGIAVVSARYVRRALANRNRIVVTRFTGANNLRVIHHLHGLPHRRIVAILANIGRLYVGQAFAGRIGAVVTITATRDNTGVVEICRNPCIGRMAIIAVITARKVCRGLAAGDNVVVAGHASTNDLRMVHRNGWLPERRAVTVLTGVGRLDMRHAPAGCFIAVMAIEAVCCIAGVIKQRGDPGRCLMAVVASFA